MHALSTLFAGQSTRVHYLNDDTEDVFVRALPQRYLHHVLATAEHKHELVALVTYTHSATPAKARKAAKGKGAQGPLIAPPTGYTPVTVPWTDNLTDDSVDALYELAKKLNFSRAAKWAWAQIAAKKLVAPLHEQILIQSMPIIEKVLAPFMQRLEALSSSTPKSLSSPAVSTAKPS